jgi:hypothetical protein
MREKKRRTRLWLGLGAAVVLVIVCVLIYRDDCVGSDITDLPGGFYLRVSLLERDGTVTERDVRGEAEIQAVQHYIRTQKASRLRADAQPDYPFLGLSDGTRSAVYTNGVWIDAMGRTWSVTLDIAEILALVDGAPSRSAALRDFPNRFRAGYMTGAWDARLLEPAEPLPELGDLQIRARERSEDKIFVTVYNPSEALVKCRPEVRLEVLADGAWYTVPQEEGTEPAAAAEETLEPYSSILFTASIEEVERRYAKLPAGHYRIVLLSYDAEFDVE